MDNLIQTEPFLPAPYRQQVGESYMSQRQLIYFETILLMRKHFLLKKINKIFSYIQSESSKYADSMDRASQEQNLDLEFKIWSNERQLVKEVESTLLRLKSRKFGYCVDCGEEIGLRRLEANVITKLCIDCKMILEARQQHGG